MLRRTSRKLLVLALPVLVAACNGSAAQEQAVVVDAQEEKPKLGLFTTLPIYWGEGGDISAMLDGGGETDWVRTELETRFEIVPLDTLESDALEGLDRVLLAQPRPLAPSENVAFDRYLADGGKAVIMADPMLTRHSEFAIGDRRRPQDVVLLSPILKRLGIELRFDESQPEGERTIQQAGRNFPVNLAGQFVAQPDESPDRHCIVPDPGLLARCRNGEGEALLYADAALLDWEDEEPVPASRRMALWSILEPLASDSTTPSVN